MISAKALGFEKRVTTVSESIERGLCPENAEDITVLGDVVRIIENVRPADGNDGSIKALKFFSRGKLGRMFMPKPVVCAGICRGCGDCVRSCPQKTIELTETQTGKKAKINHSKCIRCYCCQELCPFLAIKIKRNFFTKAISKIK